MGKPYRSWILVALLFFLPFAGILWLSEEADRETRLLERQTATDNASRILAHYSRLADPDFFLQDTVARIKRALVWGGDPQPFFSRFPAGLAKFYLFSPKGKRILKPGFATEFIFASETCLSLIRKAYQKKLTVLSLKEKNLAESIFGDAQAVRIMAGKPNHLHGLDSFGVPKQVGIFPFRTRKASGGFFLAVIDSNKLPRFELTRGALFKIQALTGPTFTFGFEDLQGEFPPQPENAVPTAGVIPSEQEDSVREIGGRLWTFHTLDRRWRLFGSCAAPGARPGFGERHRSVLGAGACLFVLFIGLIILGEKRGVSIRIQIPGLFFMATLACICALMGFAGIYTEMWQGSLLRERLVQTQQILEKADSSFLAFQDGIAARYRALLPRLAENFSSPVKIRKILDLLQRGKEKVSVRLIDTSGKLLYEANSEADVLMNNLWGKEFRKNMARVGKLALKVYNAKVRTGTRGSDPSIDQETVAVKRAGILIYDNYGKLKPLPFGFYQLPMFADFVLGEDGVAKGMLWIMHEERVVETRFCSFLRKKRASRFPATFQFRIFPVFQGKTSQAGVPYPLLEKILRDANGLIQQGSSLVSRQFELGHSRMLLAGIQGKALESHNLFLLTSLKDIDQKRRENTRMFIWTMALIVLFTLAQSSVFSRMVMDPIHNLLLALKHLTNSDFDHQIDIRSGDEFETIGRGLNQVFEEMKELAIARNIQEHLFPPAPLEIPWGKCFGVNRSSSEIGGEFYDFQTLDENRMAFLIVRVPGHSIGSALILAMVKMAVRLLLDVGRGEGLTLLKNLREILFTKVKGGAEASILLGIYQHDLRTLDLASQGGPFLLFRSSRGASSGAESILTEVSGRGPEAVLLDPIHLEAGETFLAFSQSVHDRQKAFRALNGIFSEPVSPQVLFDQLDSLTLNESGGTRTMVAIEVKHT